MKLGGRNHKFQLCEKSNKVESDGTGYIFPPIDFELDPSLLSSYYTFYDRSIWITKKGQAFSVGANKERQIIGTLPQEFIKNKKEIRFTDKNGRQCKFLSAVCPERFTLYLISGEEGENNQLALVFKGKNSGNPIFLNINGHNPRYLFAGDKYAATINTDGTIFILHKDVLNSPEDEIEASSLPGGESAVDAACCDDDFYVLGSSGRLFVSSRRSDFSLVEELKGIKIKEVSGTYIHSLAVAEDGRVFGCGANYHGRIGHRESQSYYSEFKEIKEIKKHKIISASAGIYHSLFVTSEGKVLACGKNSNGELILKDDSHEECNTPEETMIKSGAKFCLAGYSISVIFTGDVPPNQPNRRITETEDKPLKKSDEKKRDTEDVAQLKKEIKELQTMNDELKAALSITMRPNSNTKEDNFFIDDSIEEEFFENLGQIGEGATSVTYKVVDKRANQPLCKKVLKYNKGQATIKDAQNALKEFQVLYGIDYPCICKSVAVNMSETIEVIVKGEKQKVTTVSLFLEYLEYSLDEVLKSKINNTLKVKIVLEIVHAMKYLHKRGMIHRDLKIENIMLNSVLETKLVDFGLVRINECVLNGYSFVDDSLTKGIGTFGYMSPEMLNEEDYDNKTDVYSFGVVLYYMFFGSIPKQSLKDKTTGKQIKVPSSPSSSVSQFCIDLITKCLSPDPANRPSFESILDEMRKKSFGLASNIDPGILSRRDKELEIIGNMK